MPTKRSPWNDAHCFFAYKTYAWGSQELKPISKKPVLDNYLDFNFKSNKKVVDVFNFILSSCVKDSNKNM